MKAAEYVRCNPPIILGELPLKRTIADIDLIKEKIGWEPKIMLEEWIKDIVATKRFDMI